MTREPPEKSMVLAMEQGWMCGIDFIPHPRVAACDGDFQLRMRGLPAWWAAAAKAMSLYI
jgi:hypothetical protein